MGGMWTKQQRARQARFERQRYPTDVTNEEWTGQSRPADAFAPPDDRVGKPARRPTARREIARRR
jgi:hypothetical protein